MTNMYPSGLYVNKVFTPNLAILQELYDIWNATIPSISNVANIQHGIIFQRLPATIPSADNSLGVGPSAVFDVICLLSITWTDEKDDALIHSSTEALTDRITQAIKKASVARDFEYLNYAAYFQNPLAGYGASNYNALKSVSKTYDPVGFFQTGVPGGFKL